MIVSKVTLMLIISVVLLSIFCANIALQLDIDIGLRTRSRRDDEYQRPTNVTVTESASRLMWFLQVSDLHLSIFTDPSRVSELEEFCNSTIDVIKPPVVLASGDLTDAKHKNNMGSAQYKDEWIIYNDVLKRCNIKNKTLWLDIRGNHDNFNVPGWESSLNYFKEYSIQGVENTRSYMHTIQFAGAKYSFIGLDACLEPGPRRPFNFIGILTLEELERVKQFLKKIEADGVDNVIWFGHYPSSCIISHGEDTVRELIGGYKPSLVYLCGHLHQIGGLVTEMYALQRQGYLELELGDWKDNRVLRLAAVDHGIFSFVDVRHGTWPIILITNPKHALYAMPDREPLQLISKSSHIRLLAFSPSQIDLVQIKLDDGEWSTCRHVEGPLYTHPWNPSMYPEGLHTIYARVYDVQGRDRIVEQPFSIDGTKMNFKILSKFALMINAVRFFQCMFGTMIVLCIIPLIIIRYFHYQILTKKTPPLTLRNKYNYKWLRRLWVLASVDGLFYPLVLYEMYLIFGPWSVGEIMDDHIGAIFAWGIIIDGAYLPGSFTYAYGFIQMFICQFPLTLLLAKYADERYLFHWGGKNIRRSLCRAMITHSPFILIISIQMVLAYFFWLAYGTLAFLLGPLRTWSILLNFYLWHKSITLSSEATREVASVWMSHVQNPKKETARIRHISSYHSTNFS